MSSRTVILGALALLALSACSERQAYTVVSTAQDLPARTAGEQTVLDVRDGDRSTPLTLRQLQAMRTVEYRVNHPHIKRELTFRGVLLSDLAATTGLQGRDLRVEATDGYGATIRATDYENGPVMLAFDAEGQPLTFQEKGPLTVIFPIHSHADRYPTVKYGSQWVWYVRRVTGQ